MRTTLLVMLFALAAAAPLLAFSGDEEARIREAAQGMDGLSAAQAALAPGCLSSTARTLAPLVRACGEDHVRAGLAWLLEHKLLPDARLSWSLREAHEACGPYRHITRTLFRPGTVTAATAFFLYDPKTGDYSLGGVLATGQTGEVLVRREDGVVVMMLPDGRVAFLPEHAVRVLARDAPAAPLPADHLLTTAVRAGYSYSAVQAGQAKVHLVRIDLDKLPLAYAVAPYYNTLAQGPERTQPVDGMARKYGAKVAINGTFFNDQPTHPQYGYPIGSFLLGGRLAWNLTAQNLLRFERCYAATCDDGRLVLGQTALPGDQIRAQNLAGQFDPNRIGSSRIINLGTGFGWLIRDRKADAWKNYAGKQFDASFYSRNSHRARSLLGVDQSGHQAFLVAEEEGPTSPVPMSMPDLAEWVATRARVQDMVFLDGGGSTQLVIEGKNVSAPADGSYRKNSTAVLCVPAPHPSESAN